MEMPEDLRETLGGLARERLERELTPREWSRFWSHASVCSLSLEAQTWLMERFIEGLNGLDLMAPEYLCYKTWQFRRAPREGKRRPPKMRCKYPICRKGGIRKKRPKMFYRLESPYDPYCSKECLDAQKSRYGWYYKRLASGKLIRMEKRTCTAKGCKARFWPPSRKTTRCSRHRWHKPKPKTI